MGVPDATLRNPSGVSKHSTVSADGPVSGDRAVDQLLNDEKPITGAAATSTGALTAASFCESTRTKVSDVWFEDCLEHPDDASEEEVIGDGWKQWHEKHPEAENLWSERQPPEAEQVFHEVGTFALLSTSKSDSWVQCEHGTVRVEGNQLKPHGFLMKRCEDPKCVQDAEEWWKINRHLLTEVEQPAVVAVCEKRDEQIAQAIPHVTVHEAKFLS